MSFDFERLFASQRPPTEYFENEPATYSYYKPINHFFNKDVYDLHMISFIFRRAQAFLPFPRAETLSDK
jgi:hypothetical protein